MWKGIGQSFSKIELFFKPEILCQQQIRTTFVLKRRYAPLLHKKGCFPKKLKNRHYIYDLIQDKNSLKQPNLEVILKTYVEGIGKAGDKVSLRPTFAYNELLLPGLAVYATQENAEKYKHLAENVDEEIHSSPTAQRTINVLSGVTLSVVMNIKNSWVIQPWHIKACFRKCGYHVPEEAITLPPKPIKGPDMSLQGKQFYVTVTVNNLETVKVRCLIHHWSSTLSERLQYEYEFWKKPVECVFPEDEPIISSLRSTQKHVMKTT